MIKGHTIITLTNEDTKEVEQIESDNFITDLYKDMAMPYGVYGNCYSESSNLTLLDKIRNISQGVMLFDNTFSTSADNYFIPTNTTMIGRGANISYNGTDTTMGNYSTSKSNVITNSNGSLKSITYSWDFNSTQANGEISSICLCPINTAKAGFGTNDYYNENTVSDTCGSLNKPVGYNYCNTHYPIYMDFPNDKFYVITNQYCTGETLTVESYRIPIHTYELTDSENYSENRSKYLLEINTIAIPSAIQTLMKNSTYSNVNWSVTSEGIALIMLPSNRGMILQNETIYVLKVKMSDLTTTVETFTNGTGYSINTNTTQNSNVVKTWYANGKVIVYNTNGDFWSCNTDGTCTQFNKIDETKANLPSDNWDVNNQQHYIINNNLCISIRNASSSSYTIIILDTVTNTLKFTNIHSALSQLAYSMIPNFEKQLYTLGYNGNFSYFYTHPFTLFSINNLSSVITKTNNKSMNITYTLTFDYS